MSEPSRVHVVPGSADQSLGTLVNNAITEVRQLIKMEKELAVAEVAQTGRRLQPAVAGYGTAALAALYFLLFGSVALAFGIGYLLTLGWGFTIVTGIWMMILAIGALVGRSAVKKIKKPERTVRTVKDTAEWARHPSVHPALTVDAS
jgi:Putative Actinobacterial Holin-X, holin superfamily III